MTKNSTRGLDCVAAETRKSEVISGRKRRRSGISRSASPGSETTVPQTKHSRSIDKGSCSQGPLSGCLLAVTSLLEASSGGDTLGDKPTTHDGTEHSYNNLIQLCRESGAQTTSQVHQRVSCVVATQSAVIGQTQRVRKAWKKGIPVVSPEWVRQCVASGKKVGWGDFVHKQPARKRGEPLPERRKSTVGTKESLVPTDIALGCCCACHESNDSDCPWCVSCRAPPDAST